jgi:hypothetical protein
MRNIFLVPILFLILACNSMKKSADIRDSKSTLFTTLYSSESKGRAEASNVIVKSQEDLNALFQSLEVQEIPKVDFSKNQVVALFLGQRSNGGFSILIDRVEVEGEKVVIYKKVQTPKMGEVVTMALTTPVVIAEIHSTKEIIFK